MKRNNNNEIEQQLTPKCEFHASEDLVGKVLNAAAEEARPSTAAAPAFRWRAVFAAAAAVAAVVALFITVKPVGTPAYAAENLFARAAEYFTMVNGYSVHFDVRTEPQEQFSYSNPTKGIVHHTMTVASDGRGWKHDSDKTGIIFPFDNLLDLGGMMRWLEEYVAGSHGADCRKVEDDETVKLIVTVPAQGDYSNSYMKQASIGDSDTKQTYVFSKADGRLLSAKIDTKVLGVSRTLLNAKSIDYDTAITESTFALPMNVEWLDHTRKALAGLATELPMGEFAGIGAEEAVEKLFKALHDWDEPMLKAVLRAYPLKRIEAKGFKGCTLVKRGESFRSGSYAGVFVPCEVQLATGRKIKVKLALRDDNQWHAWTVDGGI